MKGLNLSGFQKTKEDENTAELMHKDGHKIIIAKKALPHSHRKQLEALPFSKKQKMAEGGTAGDDLSDIIPQEQNASSADTPAAASPSGASGSWDSADTPAAASPSGASGSWDSAQTQQDPEMQQQQQPQQGDFQTPVGSRMPGLQAEQAANIQGAQAMGKEGAQTAREIEDTQGLIDSMPSQSDIIEGNKAKQMQLEKAYMDQKIDPKAYWTDHSKVAAGIGLLLSGVGQVMGAKTNGALEAIDEGVNREIDRQKNEQGKALNLYQMNQNALGNDLAANLATQNQLYTGLKYSIQKAAAENAGPMAMANAQRANAQIQQTIDGNNFKMSLVNPTRDNPDPSTRVQFLVPPERQQKVFDEIEAAQNTSANGPGIMQAFDNAAKEVRPLTGGTGTSLTAFNPSIKSANQKALIARMGPTFKDVEGTVRQAAMDNMEHNTTPQFGDSDNTIATKRASLIQYLRSKEAAPTAKGFGIDLSRFPSTATSRIGTAQTAIDKPMTVVQNGHTYNLNPKTGSYE